MCLKSVSQLNFSCLIPPLLSTPSFKGQLALFSVAMKFCTVSGQMSPLENIFTLRHLFYLLCLIFDKFLMKGRFCWVLLPHV